MAMMPADPMIFGSAALSGIPVANSAVGAPVEVDIPSDTY